MKRYLRSAAIYLAGFVTACLLVPLARGKAEPAPAPPPPLLATTLARPTDAAPIPAPWGEWRRHLRGDTHGTRGFVVSRFTLKPGQAPHPPHQHADEEIMILAEGSGTWHLEGKESPARTGDVAYASPFGMHGLRNSGTTPLSYYVIKWTGKGVSPPPAPVR